MYRLSVFCLVAASLPAQQTTSQPQATAPKPSLVAATPTTSAQYYSRVLQDPVRDPWQKPDDVVAAMALVSTDTVAEFGSGSGYYGRRIALQAKRVYVISDSPAVLSQAALEAPSNLSTILSDASSLHIPANAIDKIVINGLLELSVDDVALLTQVYAGLKPTAKIYLIDFFQSVSLLLPAKYSIASVSAVLQLFGFRLLQNASVVSTQGILIFGH